MHVFIDTNILLTFYHFSDEELDALNDVFASHEHGAATVHLTEQVQDEFRRNREAKIKDALKRFKETKFSPQLPSFMKAYDEFTEIRKLASDLKLKAKAILEKADTDIAKEDLVADALIRDIFDKSEIIATTDEVYQQARKRMDVGNPPGKNSSIGDAINWLTLLRTVPEGENIHIISADGDFFSQIDDKRAHPFLGKEWAKNKKSTMRVYRTLSAFLGEHFDGVAFSFDKEKDGLIDDLALCGSFASTHGVIAKLENYGYFSRAEVERILQAAVDNDQVRWIVTDYDVSDFLNRIAVPRRAEITRADYLEILDKVVEEKAERDDD